MMALFKPSKSECVQLGSLILARAFSTAYTFMQVLTISSTSISGSVAYHFEALAPTLLSSLPSAFR